MTHWFTSDWHLGHANIIKYSKRPFKDTTEMDAHYLGMFKGLQRGDTLYHLGDLCFDAKYLPKIEELIKSSGIQFHMITGNHDTKKIKPGADIKGMSSISQLKTIKVGEQTIVLCHYMMRSWDHSHFGSWQLYGHHHKDVSEHHVGKQMNVGVDVNNHWLVQFEKIKEYMESQPINWDLLSEEKINQRAKLNDPPNILA